MAETKAPAPQTNVRAPIEARDTLLRIGGLLRGDPAFLARLRDFLDEYEGDEPAGLTLGERVARLEARLAALETR